jgi:hypothetical protein
MAVDGKPEVNHSAASDSPPFTSLTVWLEVNHSTYEYNFLKKVLSGERPSSILILPWVR